MTLTAPWTKAILTITGIFLINAMSHAAESTTVSTKDGTETQEHRGILNKVKTALPAAKLSDALTSKTEAVRRGYVGVGFTQRLVHGNAEWVNPYGIAYLKAGVFNNDDRPYGAQIGFRYPYYLTNERSNGYYIGAYAGHLDNIRLDGKAYQPIGGGIDLAYVALSKESISTVSVGIGAAQSLLGPRGSKKDVEPQIQFAYSLSFGVF